MLGRDSAHAAVARSTFSFLGALALIFAFTEVWALADDVWTVERLKRQCELDHEETTRFLENISAVCETRVTHGAAGAQGKNDALDVKYSTRGALTRVDVQFPDDDGGVVSIVEAPEDILFTVSKHIRDKDFKIDSYGSRSSDNTESTRFLMSRYKDVILSCMINVGLFNVRELINSPLTNITNIVVGEERGERTITVFFSMEPSSTTRGFDGAFSLFLDRKMAVMKYGYTASDDHATAFSGSVKYLGGEPHGIIPSEVEYHATAGRSPATDIVAKFSTFEKSSVPEAHFTLDAFGLGDFSPTRRPSLILPAIILANAAVVLWIAVTIYRRARAKQLRRS